MSRVAFIMVADGPRFEVPAMILAGSIRHIHGRSVGIYAYCPEPKMAEFGPLFRDVMAHHDVTIAPIPDGRDLWQEPYPHGNKLLACAAPRPEDHTVYLDTDMVMLSDVSDLWQGDIVHTGHVSVVPEGIPTWGRDDADWRPAYDLFDLPVPTTRVRMCRGKRRLTLPYFNAGFVSWLDEGTQFGQTWLDTAIEIDRCGAIESKRPWLDQIALPVAIARTGLDMNVAEQRYNFSLYRREFPVQAPMSIAHYHIPAVFRAEPACKDMLESVISNLPEPLSGGLREDTLPFMMAIKRLRRAQKRQAMAIAAE